MSPWIALAAGLLSFLSPCILPVIPVYIAIISGLEPGAMQKGAQRRSIFLHSLSFICGFTVIFVLLGTGAGVIGSAITSNLELVRQIAGSIMILMGLYTLLAFKIPWLNYEKRFSGGFGKTGGYLRSFIIGVLFTFAWTPCVGPVLAGILALAFNSTSVWQGGVLLAFYSLGIGVPFLILGIFFDWMSPRLKNMGRYLAYINVFSGLLLILIGILILLNRLSWLNIN
jgi:cytochrome c-type biogenesis protein